jgi:phenylalanyl-tRNA synthetase alpha subunit
MFGITIADCYCLCSVSTVKLSNSLVRCTTRTHCSAYCYCNRFCTLAYSHEQLPAGASEAERVEFVMADLKAGLEGMARALFGDVEMRWVDAYFPFTDPSAELEIFFGVSMTHY